ncbi:MBL fold metallo-hydrolase [Lacicoccus alkaliphilus]|uniref:Ribonuclease Z n=1 Tax=Lacicoccus alkaliphilus DSM 16010 TaxID=1123231 RepID=A0A1M7BE31_9BACL|nr:MBL fold metallo-hydrolase [Salinicoccus alkaliphilus]SHL53270.1 ribonuclease Z [Salinicoccus alkaliphilus DSM 16010]
MQFTVLGSGAGLPSKKRHTQSYILDAVDETNQYILIDAGEALQHRILHTSIKPSKVRSIFITHLHGDHIYGLPGFLSSRAHQGGEDLPLTIYGPKGLANWLDITFEISGSRLNYPLSIVEVGHKDCIEIDNFKVHVRLLDHNIDSFLYVFKENDKTGALDPDKLKGIGIEPGPLYAEIKKADVFEFNGETYRTSDFTGPDITGRKISVHGDTRVMAEPEYLSLIDRSDVIVHEATYLDGEQEKAHRYFHSEITSVLDNLKNIDYGALLITHLSNRYEDGFLNELAKELPSGVHLTHDFFEHPILRNSQENK